MSSNKRRMSSSEIATYDDLKAFIATEICEQKENLEQITKTPILVPIAIRYRAIIPCGTNNNRTICINNNVAFTSFVTELRPISNSNASYVNIVPPHLAHSIPLVNMPFLNFPHYFIPPLPTMPIMRPIPPVYGIKKAKTST